MAIVLLCAAASFAPFDVDLPSQVPNRAVRLADGTLRFAQEGRADSTRPPPWLPEAVATSALHVELRARTAETEQDGPARLLSIAGDNRHADLVVAQEGSDLVVRIRRPGADPSGEPPYVAPAVFQDLAWHDIGLRVTAGWLVLTVDGRVVVGDWVGDDALQDWDARYPLTLGNDASGERAWSGQLARAAAGSSGVATDHLATSELDIPESWWRFRLPTLRPAVGGSGLEDLVVHVLLFGPLGFALVAADLGSGARTAAVGVALCIAIEAGQLLFARRHSSYGDLALNLACVWLGAVAARQRIRSRGGLQA